MRRKNVLPFRLALASGILLFLSGTNGYAVWRSIEDLFISIIPANPLINILFIILLFISSFGGISVIVGGYLLYRNKILPGKILIMLGSGAGILSLILKVFLIIFTDQVFDLFSSMASIGILLAISAQVLAKK